MHNCCKVGCFVGGIYVSGRFMSPTWETSSKREIGPKRGSLPPKAGGLTGMTGWLILSVRNIFSLTEKSLYLCSIFIKK